MPGYCVAGTVGHKVISGAKKIEFENRQIVIFLFSFYFHIYYYLKLYINKKMYFKIYFHTEL